MYHFKMAAKYPILFCVHFDFCQNSKCFCSFIFADKYTESLLEYQHQLQVTAQDQVGAHSQVRLYNQVTIQDNISNQNCMQTKGITEDTAQGKVSTANCVQVIDQGPGGVTIRHNVIQNQGQIDAQEEEATQIEVAANIEITFRIK